MNRENLWILKNINCSWCRCQLDGNRNWKNRNGKLKNRGNGVFKKLRDVEYKHRHQDEYQTGRMGAMINLIDCLGADD